MSSTRKLRANLHRVGGISGMVVSPLGSRAAEGAIPLHRFFFPTPFLAECILIDSLYDNFVLFTIESI